MSHLLEEHKQLQDRITEFINSIVEYLELDSAKISEFSKELCDIYSVQDFRHSYSPSYALFVRVLHSAFLPKLHPLRGRSFG